MVSKFLSSIFIFITETNFISKAFCPYVTKQYSIDMDGLDLRTTIEKLVSDNDSPFSSIFRTNTIFELGYTSKLGEASNRMRGKMGVIKNDETGLFFRRVKSFERMEGVCIVFKNVSCRNGENISAIAEKLLYNQMIHFHHGICLSTPGSFGQGVKDNKDVFGKASFALYLIGAVAYSNFDFKENLRKGRIGTEKEFQFYKKQKDREKHEILQENTATLRSLVSSNAEILSKLDKLNNMDRNEHSSEDNNEG